MVSLSGLSAVERVATEGGVAAIYPSCDVFPGEAGRDAFSLAERAGDRARPSHRTRNLSFPRRPHEYRRKWPFFLPPAALPFGRIASAPVPRHLFRRHLRSSETFLCLGWAPPWTQLKQAEKYFWRGSFRCEPAMPPPPRVVKAQGQIIPVILP